VTRDPTAAGGLLLLFDGRCGLCNRLVRFVLERDRRDRFTFAPLQSRVAAEILARHGRDARDLDTFCIVRDRGLATESVTAKGRATLLVLRTIGGAWAAASVFGVLPTAVLDFAYDRVAKNRVRLFGRTDACLVPSERDRAKFVTLELDDAV
jgi:predicted DCC family thiol-disulfide oxidoreductase YuxK